MAVKIVGHGQQEVRQVTCGQCGAVLEYGQSDVQSEPQYGDEGEYVCERRWIDCPGCSSPVTLA